MERLHYFFLFFLSLFPRITTIGERGGVLRSSDNSVTFDIQIHIRENGGFIRRESTAHFRNTAFPSTARVSIILRALLLPLLGPIIPHDRSPEFAILSAYLRVRRNKTVSSSLFGRMKSMLLISTYMYLYIWNLSHIATMIQLVFVIPY